MFSNGTPVDEKIVGICVQLEICHCFEKKVGGHLGSHFYSLASPLISTLWYSMEETDERSVFPRLQNDPWAKENIFFFKLIMEFTILLHYIVT